MGFSGSYLYVDGEWAEVDPDQSSPGSSSPWMFVSIYDSDVVTVRYGPSSGAEGEAFLGLTPRVYFEDDGASAPTDPTREAGGLARWVGLATGTPGDAGMIETFLAGDDEIDDELDLDDDDDLDDAEIFVEIQCARFLRALGLSLPPALDDFA